MEVSEVSQSGNVQRKENASSESSSEVSLDKLKRKLWLHNFSPLFPFSQAARKQRPVSSKVQANHSEVSPSWAKSASTAMCSQVCSKKRRKMFRKVSSRASPHFLRQQRARSSARACKSLSCNQSAQVSNRRARKCRPRRLSCRAASNPSHRSSRSPSIFKDKKQTFLTFYL